MVPEVLSEPCDCNEISYHQDYNIFYRSSPEQPLDGTCQALYADGSKKEERNYRNGKMEGSYKMWHANGTLGMEKNFVNNKQEGESREWDETGKLTHAGLYKDGKFVRKLEE